MSKTTVEVMAETFCDMGTPFIAGHPGGDTVHLMDAARVRDMRYVLTKQEVAGAILAATYGEITGSPGVCTSTRGPGATNMVNGAAYAWSDRAPLLLLTDQYPTDILETRLRQTIDHRTIYTPITKWSTTLQAKTANLQLHHAIQVATSGTPGPVHIDLPSPELTKEVPEMMGQPAMFPDRGFIEPDKKALRKPLDMIPDLSLTSVPTLNGLIPFEYVMVGDLKLLLNGLVEFCEPGQGWGVQAASDFRIAVSNALNTPCKGLSPQAAMEAAVDVMPRETIATCERGFLTSNGLGTMGYAIPGAIGARLARPKTPIVAFAGDGGFLMAVAELQTAVKENLPIIVVVLDDEEIALIRIKQAIKGVKRHGVDVGGLNWESLAHGFGADGVVVDTAPQLGDALQGALKSGRTTLIVAKIDGSGYIDLHKKAVILRLLTCSKKQDKKRLLN